MINAKNISKIFNIGETKITVLHNISFDIYEGELIVILGPSGSGKSTLLNIIGGIDTITSGEIKYKNINLGSAKKKELAQYRRNCVGFIFQFYNLLPNLTVKENIELVSEMSSNPISLESLIKDIELEDRINYFPSKLSGGQQQRVAIARALCKNPDLLLCDEPTGALDVKTGLQILQLISKFNKQYNKTVIIITHNPNIAKIANRIFYIKDGMISKIELNSNPLLPSEVKW